MQAITKQSMKKCKCKWHSNKLSEVLNFAILCVAIVMAFLAILAVVVVIFGECAKYPFAITPDGIKYFLSHFKPFESLLSGSVIVLTLSVALNTYIHSKQVDAVNSLTNIRELLATEDNMLIHELLENADDVIAIQKGDGIKLEKLKREYFEKEYYVNNKVKVFNYLGILELSNIYLDKGIISETDFMSQFGYRIENVFDNSFLKKEIEKDASYWQVLIDLHCKVTCMKNQLK